VLLCSEQENLVTERVWDAFLTEQDKAHLAASPPTGRYGFGRRAAVLSVDNYRKAIGDKPEPLLESIKTWPGSTGLAGWEALEHTKELFRVAREVGLPVIHVTGLSQEESGMAGWGARLGGRHAAPGKTPEEQDRARRRLEIVEQAAPVPGEVVLRKTGPSAFFGTPLAAHLIGAGIDTLIVCGESVSGCVRATVVDGRSLRLNIIVVEDCVYDRHESTRAMNLFDMDQKYGDVISLTETVDWITASGADGWR
jgi:nicotinamidase-related amidase